MDAILHTALALPCIAGAFYLGVFLTRREAADEIPPLVIQNLIRRGFLCVERDHEGDECLVPIEDVLEMRRKK